jgi:hypothetical protein
MAKKEDIPKTSPEEIEALIDQIKATNLDPALKAKNERLLPSLLTLISFLQRKILSLRRLRNLILDGAQRSGVKVAGRKFLNQPTKSLTSLDADRQKRIREESSLNANTWN